VGAPRGLKSRGGVVIVLGGAAGAGGVWARAMAGNAMAPNAGGRDHAAAGQLRATACFVMRAPPRRLF